MKKLAVITNSKKDPNGEITASCINILNNRFEIVCSDGIDPQKRRQALKGAFAAIVIGGDGTILSTAADAAEEEVPVLGINKGNMGFLADVELAEIDTALKALCNGRYRIEERFMLSAKAIGADGTPNELTALNDLVISRASYTRMVALDVWVDGHFLSSYVGDGVVIATPTGSTAYSLSAGGPLVDASLNVALITPVCSHTMSAKPMIVPGNAKITVKFKNTFDDVAMLNADGQRAVEISDGTEVFVEASPYKTKLIKISDRCFYEILHKKLQG